MTASDARIRAVGMTALLLCFSTFCCVGGAIAGSNDPDPNEDKDTLVDAAKNSYMATVASHDAGNAKVEDVYVWSHRLMEAEVDASVAKPDKIKAISDHVDRMQNLHAKIAALYKIASPAAPARDFHASKYYLLEAKALLKKAKAEAE